MCTKVPIYRNDPGAAVRKRQIAPIHEGALKFVADVSTAAGTQTPGLYVLPDIACRLLDEFLERPACEDAEIFANHQIEDAFNGTGRRYVLKLDRKRADIGESYWTAGAKAFSADKKDTSRPGLRDGLVLKTALPILKPNLSEHELTLYRTNPIVLLENALNPVMITIGRLAGFL